MSKKKKRERVPLGAPRGIKLRDWCFVQRQYRLSDAEVQMARELGMPAVAVGVHERKRGKRNWPRFAKFVTGRYRNTFGFVLTSGVSLEGRVREIGLNPQNDAEVKQIGRRWKKKPDKKPKWRAKPLGS